MPSSDESITAWLAGVKDGNEIAVQRIWERYFHRLSGLARTVLASSRVHGADEEDIALSAFKSFYFRAAEGKFPRLDDRNDLWKLLMTITVRKALHVRRNETKERGDQSLNLADQRFASDEPTPEMAAMVTDEFQRLLKLLDDEKLCSVALAKLEGYTSQEIARQLGKSLSFVERKLRVIRRIWSDEAPS